MSAKANPALRQSSFAYARQRFEAMLVDEKVSQVLRKRLVQLCVAHALVLLLCVPREACAHCSKLSLQLDKCDLQGAWLLLWWGTPEPGQEVERWPSFHD
jgi:hypothetical protein